jgi:hypothetical protein
MPRVIHVKKARKANKQHGIKKGDSYYWWSVMMGSRGVKRYSLTKPKASQLTNSEFWQAVYGAQESADDAPPKSIEDAEADRDNLVDELTNLKDETDDKFNNMPDGLQQGDTGQLLEERVSALDEAISELEAVDFDFEPSEDDLPEDKLEGERAAFLDEKWGEVQSALSNISCS